MSYVFIPDANPWLNLAATTCSTPDSPASIRSCLANANGGAYPAGLDLFRDVDANLGSSIILLEVVFSTTPPNTPQRLHSRC